MHNWRLLLLAFLAVLQPIASFTERNLVDGREQCCSRDSLLRDSNLAYGTHFTKSSEDRRLSREIREDRRYEVRREDPALNRASVRRLVEFRSERDVRRLSPEPTRFVRAELRREHAAESADIRRERLSASRRDDREGHVRETHRVASRDISRDMRERDFTRMRHSREGVRQQERDVREPSRFRATREGSKFTRDLDTESSFRASMESRRETRRSRDIPKERRIQEIRETRDVLQRARADVARDENTRGRQDRRVVGGAMEAKETRSESRLQVDNNRERRSLERRVRITVEESRSSTIDRVRNLREESRPHREREQRLLNRRAVSERLDERRMQRDERREYRQRSLSERRESREKDMTERRDIRDSNRASADSRNTRLDRSDIRRDSRVEERRARSRDERPASENRRTESRRMMGLMDREARHRDTDRRDYRATDRIDTRESRRDARQTLSRSRETRDREVSFTQEHRLGNLMERDTRFRSNLELIRTRETLTSIGKISEEQPNAMNWQYVFYTLQGVYLCGILMQLLTQKESDKKPRALTWFSAPQHLVKVD